ncbi:hypothetical protein Tco_0256853 [Tanacetum coccineum]
MITSMQKELQKNSQVYKVPRLKTSKEVKPTLVNDIFHDHIQGEDENAEDVQMADHLRPMEKLLQISILGIEDASIVPAVIADQFELKPELLDFKSSGSTTTHSDFSLPEYDSFIFYLLIDPFPPTNRSVSHHEEFADELAHIISPPKYDRFYFDLEIIPGDFTRVLKENIFDLSTNDLTINELNDSYLLLSDCDSSLYKEFSKIEFLVSFPSGNEDIIFDPGIFIIKGVQSERFHIFPLDNCSIIAFVSNSLLLTDPPEIKTFLSFPVENEDKVFDPRIFFINGVFSFTRTTPHLLSDNFLIDKCHILSEISLMIEFSISFHPKEKEIRGESS